MASRITTDLTVEGNISYTGILRPDVARSNLSQSSLALFPIPWTWWRVWDAYQTNLPGTSAADDLGLYGGTFATDSPSIRTYDVKTAGAVTLYARAGVPLPAEYDDGEDVVVRFHAGMLTTVADTTATIDLQAYESDGEAGIGSDLVTTAATTINSLTLADKDFVINAAGLVAGDILDMRVALAINDGASGTAVIGIIGAAYLACDIRG